MSAVLSGLVRDDAHHAIHMVTFGGGNPRTADQGELAGALTALLNSRHNLHLKPADVLAELPVLLDEAAA